MSGHLTPEQRYGEWVRYLEAAYKDIIHAFWNRHVFRTMQKMFAENSDLRDGGLIALGWIDEMYSNYAVMLVRRELDGKQKVLTLTRMLYDIEQHHSVLVSHAKGRRVPSIDEVRADREALQEATKNVVAYGNRIVAHRIAPGALDIKWSELDDALRAVRKTLIKYNGVLKASDLLSATPTPRFDWLAPFRVAWVREGFEEPEAEEEAPLSDAEKDARREHRRKWGFNQ